MLANIIVYVLQFIATFYMTIVLLRFLLQLARADFYNPITQFVVKATTPPLRVLRKIIPGWGGIDGASLVLATAIQAFVIYLILVGNLGGLPAINPIHLVAWAVLAILQLIVTIYFWSVIAIVVASWIAPTSSHPALQLIGQLTEPVMAPVRKVMPPMGGLDLSPIAVFLLLNVIKMVITEMQKAAGMPGMAVLGM